MNWVNSQQLESLSLEGNLSNSLTYCVGVACAPKLFKTLGAFNMKSTHFT